MFVFHFVYSVFFVLLCVLFLLLYVAVSFLLEHEFTDHCHRVETQLQKIHIISFQIFCLWEVQKTKYQSLFLSKLCTVSKNSA
jgi:hypothetical protein